MWFAVISSFTLLGMSAAYNYDWDGRGESGDPDNTASLYKVVLNNLAGAVAMFGCCVPEPLAGLPKMAAFVASKDMSDYGITVVNDSDATDIGCIEVMLTDKTGTITSDDMVVESVLLPDMVVESVLLPDMEERFQKPPMLLAVAAQEPTQELARALVTCTKAEVKGDKAR